MNGMGDASKNSTDANHKNKQGFLAGIPVVVTPQLSEIIQGTDKQDQICKYNHGFKKNETPYSDEGVIEIHLGLQ